MSNWLTAIDFDFILWNRDYRESTVSIVLKFYMTKVSGGGQCYVYGLVNRSQNFVVTGLNRLSVYKPPVSNVPSRLPISNLFTLWRHDDALWLAAAVAGSLLLVLLRTTSRVPAKCWGARMFNFIIYYVITFYIVDGVGAPSETFFQYLF